MKLSGNLVQHFSGILCSIIIFMIKNFEREIRIYCCPVENMFTYKAL